MSKTFLLTGCCGFIGSHMSEFLVNKGFKVIGIDNLLTGKLENINSIINNRNFDFIKHDICKKIKIGSKIDYIIHLASPASPIDYLKFPIKTLQINSLGTENILNLGVLNQCTVLVASTSEVYGDPLQHPQNEDYYGNVNPIGPRSVYDEAKRYLEALTMAYHKKRNLDTRIVRIFNTYGPKMRIDDGRVIPNFIYQAINNYDFTIFGNGNQTRSFCYVDDTILGIFRLINSNYIKPVNIGNSKEYTILDLSKKIKTILSSESKNIFLELPENDPKVRKPDLTLAKRILKWEPKVSLDEGLYKTIKYFRNL